MALWPLYLGLKYHRPVRLPDAPSAPAGTAGSRRPARSAAPGTPSSTAGAASASSSAGSGHDYFPSPDHSAMYGAGLNLEQLAYAVLLDRARRLRLAAARGRLRRLRARRAWRCRSPTRCRARRCSRCRGSRSASSRCSSRSGMLGRAAAAEHRPARRPSRCCSGSTSPAGCSGSGSPEPERSDQARRARPARPRSWPR